MKEKGKASNAVHLINGWQSNAHQLELTRIGLIEVLPASLKFSDRADKTEQRETKSAYRVDNIDSAINLFKCSSWNSNLISSDCRAF